MSMPLTLTAHGLAKREEGALSHAIVPHTIKGRKEIKGQNSSREG